MEIRETADGSATLFSPEFGETYHSVNGAITESEHVFMQAGLHCCKSESIAVLEIGFGTGLNALLTFQQAEKSKRHFSYSSIEKFPVPENIYKKLHFFINGFLEKEFLFLHQSDWDTEIIVSEYFRLTKIKTDIATHDYGTEKFDVVYFDAFSPNIQPELWTAEIFDSIYRAMKSGGILTTYCAKGQVRRNMQAAGFVVERLPGPPGKREMLRGIKK